MFLKVRGRRGRPARNPGEPLGIEPAEHNYSLLCGGTVDLLVSSIWLAAVILLIARAFQQRDLLPALKSVEPPSSRPAKVAVIVPARDEAANIERCLRSLVAQTYPQSTLRIVAIDDHSRDRTLAIATSLAENYPQLTVLRSPPLPPHWIGKSHACWIGARAVEEDVDWLCFIDADVWAEPALIASAIAAASAETLDLLSLAPRQELQSFAERLVMPCGLYLLAFCQDLRSVQARGSSEVTATGQFMLVRRGWYEAIGGHAAVRGAICEDLMLARLLKRAGGHALLQDGRQFLSTRMYRGWSTLWIGIAKNLSEMLGGPLRTVAIAAAAVALAWAAWLIPLLDGLNCAAGSWTGCVGLVPASLGSAAAFGLHIAGATYFGIPPWYGLLFPLGYSAGALIAIDSVRRRLSGRISWKGRTYP
jgi:chlorobactene glucosyltransferase